MRALIKDDDRFSLSAHAAEHRLSPRKSSILFTRILRACSLAMAHRQLAGPYDPFWSGYRSIECSRDGLRPMSARKFSKLFHRESMVMPLPPYKSQSALFGFVHRWNMRLHVAYSAVLDALWNCFPDLQPQLFDVPRCRAFVKTGFSFPQIQRHNHAVSPLEVDGALFKTVQ